MKVTEEQFKKELFEKYPHPLDFTYDDKRDKRGNTVRVFFDRETKEVFGSVLNSKIYFISKPLL